MSQRDLLSRNADLLRTRRARARAELQQMLEMARQAGAAIYGDGRVDVGTLVDVWSTGDHGDESQTLFVVPPNLPPPDECAAVPATSPAGRALLGRRVGETVDIPWGDSRRTWTVLEISR